MRTLKNTNGMLAFGAGVILLAVAVPAAADHHESGDKKFTFESARVTPVTVGGISPTGAPYGGNYLTGTSKAKYENGKMTTSKYTCISMTQPPNDSIFKAHMMCDVVEADGTFTVVMGCQFLKADGSDMSCLGGMQGKTGVYKGRNGSMTNHSTGSKASGTGQWFN
jgi:hypothetical protein